MTVTRSRLSMRTPSDTCCNRCARSSWPRPWTGHGPTKETHALAPDVVLLDVRRRGMDGLEAARHLIVRKEPPAVIFTTAYDSYAVEAFDAHAVGYLLKPVRKEQLAASLARAGRLTRDRKSTRLNSSHLVISYAVFCLKKKKNIRDCVIDVG